MTRNQRTTALLSKSEQSFKIWTTHQQWFTRCPRSTQHATLRLKSTGLACLLFREPCRKTPQISFSRTLRGLRNSPETCFNKREPRRWLSMIIFHSLRRWCVGSQSFSGGLEAFRLTESWVSCLRTEFSDNSSQGCCLALARARQVTNRSDSWSLAKSRWSRKS